MCYVLWGWGNQKQQGHLLTGPLQAAGLKGGFPQSSSELLLVSFLFFFFLLLIGALDENKMGEGTASPSRQLCAANKSAAMHSDTRNT